MGIKPESPAPARNSGRHKPSEAPPQRTIEKRHYTQLNAAFTELRDSISSIRVVMAEEGEENATNDPQEAMPIAIVDKEAIICRATEYISLLEERNKSLLEERIALQSTIAAFEMLFPRY
ncbi:hypothetical protein B0T10DRAFT_494380 [Thelonectria olida]|uniref:BHLH domain-containing protein n=1 Tax=Thelonectria olida TaxID=1576542 RepID=A0A9P8VX27_9HYPO|nr:hypothetical protein B0T10DRAFT_494380 [Thelonectria olida]